MELYVLNKNLERISIVDEFESLIWCERYFEAGAVDLQLHATPKNIEIFDFGNYIMRSDDVSIYRIEAKEINTSANKDNSLIIGAIDCKNILSQRIIWNTINFQGRVEDYVRKMITENIINPTDEKRRIDNFLMKEEKIFFDFIIESVEHKNLYEKVKEICEAYKMGWRITFEDGNFYFDLFRGKDCSCSQDKNQKIIFSPEYDNLGGSKYKFDSSEYKNSALIGGKGEGVDRIFADIGDSTGLERFEMFVDDASSENEGISELAYLSRLRSTGQNEIAKTNTTTVFEGNIISNLYEYKKDWFLGDVITIENEYGMKSDARIVEVIETWDKDGYTIEPKFEYNSYIPEISPECLEAELILNITENTDEPIYLNKEDYPLGLTIEVYGKKGENGQAGANGGAGTPYNSVTGADAKPGKGGKGGQGGFVGDNLEMNFSVDSVNYYVQSAGGHAGGGGGGGGAGYARNQNYSAGGYGGAGGVGNYGAGYLFEFKGQDIVLKNINFIPNDIQGGKGQDGEDGAYSTNSAGDGGDGGAGGKATDGTAGGGRSADTNSRGGAGGKGGSPTAIRQEGAECNYTHAMAIDGTAENNGCVKVYYWKVKEELLNV